MQAKDLGPPQFSQGGPSQEARNARNRQFMQGGQAADPSIRNADPLADSAPLFKSYIGEKISGATGDTYTILRKIGSGGTSTVYSASNTKTDERVAVKFVGKDFSEITEQDNVRLGLEIEALGRLDHPNIIKLIDAGKYMNRKFMVMEYVKGVPLSDTLADRKMVPWSRAKSMLLQVCGAMAEAHAQNIINRDVKPSNIIIQKNGNVKLIDFGTVKVPEATAGTQTGAIVGSFRYMSPEQLDDSRKADCRSDIYSLGAVMYELITKTTPFDMHGTALLKSIAMGDAPAPSKRRPDLGIPGRIDKIILKALERDPDKRFQTMKEFAEALRSCNWDDKKRRNANRGKTPAAVHGMEKEDRKPLGIREEPPKKTKDDTTVADASFMYQNWDSGAHRSSHIGKILLAISAGLVVAGAAIGVVSLHSARQHAKAEQSAVHARPATAEPDASIWSAMADSLSSPETKDSAAGSGTMHQKKGAAKNAKKAGSKAGAQHHKNRANDGVESNSW
jgi:serine/threonine protein kinase